MASLSARRKFQFWNLLLANLSLVGTLILYFAGVLLLSDFTRDAIALNTIPLLAAAFAVTGVAVAFHPTVTWTSLGLARLKFIGFGTGLAVGSVAVGILVGLVLVAGWGTWTQPDAAAIRFDWRDAPWQGLALLAVGAFGEELFLRGVTLQFLARAIGPAAAVVATSLAFALLHGSNPDVTVVAQLNTALFGVVFGLAVVRFESLWMAAGLHLGWNVTQAGFGVNTSGITMRLTEFNLESRSAEWLTGGDYGLEGGALATGMALLLALALWHASRPARPGRMLWEQTDSESVDVSDTSLASSLGPATGSGRPGVGTGRPPDA